MNKKDLTELFRFNDWANQTMFECAEQLPSEVLNSVAGESATSALDTMAHIIGAEWIWITRWQRRPAVSMPDWVKTPVLAELRQRMNEVQRDRDEFIAGVPENEIDTIISYKRLNGEALQNALNDTLFHVVNHSSYHRGQFATKVRQLGHNPATTDYIVYARLSHKVHFS